MTWKEGQGHDSGGQAVQEPGAKGKRTGHGLTGVRPELRRRGSAAGECRDCAERSGETWLRSSSYLNIHLVA
jgi:hypothetical protein